MASIDTDRPTVLAQHELPLANPANQRAVLSEVKQSLEGLDDRTRRKGLLLVTALAVQCSMLSPRNGQSMRLQIDRYADRLRIVASVSEGILPVAFWDVVGGAVATVFADDWQIERDHSGAWFDIERIGS